ncbi:MAG: hypothetical protein ACTHNU_06655 [Gaiellales bacterium]
MSQPSAVKLAVQRAARRTEAAIRAGDLAAVRAQLSPEFAQRDNELGDLLERTESCELIGTVATRTLLHLHLRDGDDRVVELLWQESGGDWQVLDCRVFSLIPGE